MVVLTIVPSFFGFLAASSEAHWQTWESMRACKLKRPNYPQQPSRSRLSPGSRRHSRRAGRLEGGGTTDAATLPTIATPTNLSLPLSSFTILLVFFVSGIAMGMEWNRRLAQWLFFFLISLCYVRTRAANHINRFPSPSFLPPRQTTLVSCNCSIRARRRDCCRKTERRERIVRATD